MTIRGWKTRYREIRGMFGYKESDDIASAKKLNSIIEKKFRSSNFKKKIFWENCFCGRCRSIIRWCNYSHEKI